MKILFVMPELAMLNGDPFSFKADVGKGNNCASGCFYGCACGCDLGCGKGVNGDDEPWL